MSSTLKVTSPCPRRWNDLAGDGAQRFCNQCDKVVHDLDALSDASIAALRQANRNDLCITYLHDGDGIFRRRSAVRTATVAAAVVAAVVGCSSPSDVSAPSDTTAPAMQTKGTGVNDEAAANGIDAATQERLRALGGLGYYYDVDG